MKQIIPNLTKESSTEPIKRTADPLVICFNQEIPSELLLSSDLIYFYIPLLKRTKKKKRTKNNAIMTELQNITRKSKSSLNFHFTVVVGTYGTAFFFFWQRLARRSMITKPSPKSIHTYKHWNLIINKMPLVCASTISSLHCTIP